MELLLDDDLECISDANRQVDALVISHPDLDGGSTYDELHDIRDLAVCAFTATSSWSGDKR